MTADKETDLGLTLTLNLTQHKTEKKQQVHHLQHKQQEYQNQMQAQHINNLFPSFFNSALHHSKASWNPFSSGENQTHTSSMMRSSGETRTLQKASIDVNKLPSTEDYTDHDPGASSPNSTISNQSGKRSEREPDHPVCSSSDDEDGDNSRKKLRLSKDQSAILEETFNDHTTLSRPNNFGLDKWGFTGP